MERTNKPRLGLRAARYAFELEGEIERLRRRVAELEATIVELRLRAELAG